jgi:hypothetical protein
MTVLGHASPGSASPGFFRWRWLVSRSDGLPPVSELTGMDGMFGKTNIVLLILFGICCNGLAFILGVVGLIVCKDPRAKQNALIVTIIGGIFGGVAFFLRLTGRLGGF